MKIGLHIAASGMKAQSTRLQAGASNVANIASTRGADGGPHRAQEVVFADSVAGGVEVADVRDSSAAGHVTIDPAHPHADSRGKVTHSNTSLVGEMTDLIVTQRSFDANVQSFKVLQDMSLAALSTGDGD